MASINSDRKITFSQYRRTDLIIWIVILVIFEAVVVYAASHWFPSQPYSVSIEGLVTAIVFMRWGWQGLICAFVGGIEYSVLSGGTVSALITYSFGNLVSCLGLLFLLSVGKEKVLNSFLLSVLFTTVTVLSMQIGRGLVSVILGLGISNAASFILTDILSGIFAIVVVCIARKLDGVFEDQKSYLIRINENEKGEKNNE